ncbi:hypothetical protein IVB69_05370 [Flavobacterium sp. J49]|uniref:DUF6048 family protein n=1 Tax=Flavobacterium sp. J49 TaxID=2718534 RepID=UPI001593622C|nr:DUF6048 family protein [Flavobacterium sp. J49]MBF6640900.1 hypothetical protein [Flavobacterium sp. J49]NIC02147.1 hypothetical protein [Flavobacterium sp. J49]
MKYISKFTFSIALVLLSLTGNAQEKTTAKKDSIPPKMERYGLRLGVDLFKLTRSFYEKDYRGLELVGDYRLTRKHYLAAEIGNEDKTVDDEQLNFTTKGTYLKVGFDYNSYQNWLDMENIISIGLRYGVSSFSQTLNSYQLYDPNNQYFGEAPTIYPTNNEFNGLSAQWIEVVAGMKAEVFNNVFVGFSFRLNRLVTQKQPNNFENLYIPGFNRTYNGDFGVGFNYTVSYFIPLYKSTVKAKEKADKKSKTAQKK